MKGNRMTRWSQQTVAGIAMIALSFHCAVNALAQDPAQAPPPADSGFVLKVNADLVLTNVVARDAKTGELVHGLQQSDFSIYENGKLQKIGSFDFESVDQATPLNEATVSGLAAGNNSKAVAVARPEELRNHRLIVFFFDLTSMQPEDLDRSVDAAKDFHDSSERRGRLLQSAVDAVRRSRRRSDPRPDVDTVRPRR